MAAREEKTNGEAPRRRVSTVQLWFEEAWEGWLKSVGIIFLCVAMYAVYKFDLVTERVAGAGAVLLILLGALASTVVPAWILTRSPTQKAALGTLATVWLLASGYPALRTALPGRPLAELKLTTAQPTQKAEIPATGPYELSVSGHFKQAGASDAEASYALKVTGSQSGSDEVSGTLKRQMVSVRVGRRGGTSRSLQEHMEIRHRLPSVRGGSVTVSAEGVDEQLEDGLSVSVRAGGPDPLWFFVVGGLALLVALGLDARLTDGKKAKSYLAAGLAFTAVFTARYASEATPHSLVRPAVDALVLGLMAGALGGWILGAAARGLFGPRLKKAKR